MTATCPDGHVSSTEDYCDRCGIRMAPAPSAGPPAGQETELLPALTAVAARPAVDLEPCPDCGAPRMEGDQFCEDCGHDYSLASAVPSGEAHASSACWTAVVTADSERFEDLAPDGMEFPKDFVPFTIPLEQAEVRLGRAEIGGDPAVSRLHVRFCRQPDGAYALVDEGSSNGTILNDDSSPITPHVVVPLKAGDRVRIGAWTILTLMAPDGADNA
jgi:hypothetical protein